MITLWRRLPVIVRSVVLGILVTLLALPWTVLAGINFKFSPHTPWSVAVMAVYMWACWQYLSGRGWPRSTAEHRRLGLRAHRISVKEWRWCFIAFGLGWIGLKAIEFLFDEIFKIPQQAFPNVSTYPPVTVAAYILMVAIVAAMYEEAGFRGYMQGPIEKRHGPWIAYIVVGVVFWLAHITNYIGHMGLFFASVWYFVAVSALLGGLAYLTGSILPGAMLHALADAISGFVWWWQSSRVEAAGARHTSMFALAIVAIVLFVPADWWAFRKLASTARTER